MIEFKLPSLGADMDEGTLLEWKVGPGDTVGRGDVVAIVDTSKAAVDIECWEGGVVHELRVLPGERIPVGTVLATLLAPGEAPPPALIADAGSAPVATAAVEPTAAGPALTPTADSTMPHPAAAAGPEAPSSPAAAAAADRPSGMRLRISPAARRRAEALGITPGTIAGSGPQGTVTLEDVEAAARAGAGTPDAAAQPPPRAEDRGEAMRRAMAAAMSRSKRDIPHYYLGHTVNLAAASAWLESYNADRPVASRVLMAALLIRAVALACGRHPAMNGHCRDGVFQPSASVHVGVAISLRGGGLVAPAILDADRRTPPELMAALADLVRRARSGSLRSSEMGSPTITVTNLGDAGVESVHGVIYPPQVALVGFGAIQQRPVVEADRLAARPCIHASLSGDHRVSSGHQGALFLAEIARLLQQPETL